ncbi:DUF2240 family protein [archaeon]|jgi:ssDNA-binding replication factor A large subunit|nr:DUF2240 family protein [archaeon]MBT3731323.1 DUF2240 family protein [archaeon]MBT4670374.1 DUF2240 family protein [archaeon]MBT5030191.1 DUF2240 family protein [archaeon]MBT5287742.1 DUF2240 family protein [archaeon]
MGINHEEIITKICEEKGVSKEEVEGKIKEKLNQLSDLISRDGAAHIVANEYGVKVYENKNESRQAQVKDLNPMLKNVDILVKVIKLYEVRTFKTAMREGRVANLFVGDDSGSCRLVLWDENQIKEVETGRIKEDTVLKITNAYVRENRGYKELHLGGSGSWIVDPKGEDVTVKQKEEVARKYIKDLAEGENATIMGTVVQIFEPRFYDSCPECGKKVQVEGEKFSCNEHGVVESKPQGILNIVFDDGTENIRVVSFRENISKILGIEDVASLKDNADKFREVQRNVAGKQLKIQGNVKRNTFFDRLEVISFSVEDADPKELAMELKEN